MQSRTCHIIRRSCCCWRCPLGGDYRLCRREGADQQRAEEGRVPTRCAMHDVAGAPRTASLIPNLEVLTAFMDADT